MNRTQFKRRFWTVTGLRELRALYPSTGNKELAARFGRSKGAVCQAARKLGLRKSPAFIAAHCRYQERHATWNKGRPWNAPGSRATHFQRGHRGARQKPVDTERMERDRLMVKVAEPSVWVAKARLVWERYFGPIPPSMVVRLKDGDKANCAPQNLMLLTRPENMRLNAKPRKPLRRATSWAQPIFHGLFA